MDVDQVEQQLRNIFPEEVWLLIFDTMSAVEIETAANALPFFRKLLLPKYPVSQFARVLQIMTQHFYWRVENEFLLNPDVFWRNLVRARRVCRVWSEAFDSIIEKTDSPVFEETIILSGYQAEYDPTRFMQHFTSSHVKPDDRSPFVGGKLKLCNHRDSNRSGYENIPELVFPYYGQVKTMLEKYGHHVKNLSVIDDSYERLSLENLLRILELIGRMPNIKSLTIFNWTCNPSFELAADQFPVLNKLENFSAEDIIPAMFDAVVRNSKNLTSIRLKTDELRHYSIYRTFEKVELPHLKNLEIAYLSDWHYSSPRPKHMKWPLESFKFIFVTGDESCLNNWFTLFKTNWANSLKRLHLTFDMLAYYIGSKYYLNSYIVTLPTLELSQVENLTLEFRSYCSLDFILPLKNSLKELKVDYTERKNSGHYYAAGARRRTIEAEDTIKFLSCYETPLMSNVWEIFPNLEKVKCSDFLKPSSTAWEMTRKQWQQGNKKTNNLLV